VKRYFNVTCLPECPETTDLWVGSGVTAASVTFIFQNYENKFSRIALSELFM
jgi:hypothetical protein